MLAGERSTVLLANRLNNNSCFAKFVDVAAPAWPRMFYRSASVIVGGFQLQQCPCLELCFYCKDLALLHRVSPDQGRLSLHKY